MADTDSTAYTPFWIAFVGLLGTVRCDMDTKVDPHFVVTFKVCVEKESGTYACYMTPL